MVERPMTACAETKALSRYMAQAVKKPLPAKIVERAKHHILDTIAAIVSGSRLKPGAAASAYVAGLGGKPEATVIGTRLRTTTVNAALANGIAAHADETDDSNPTAHTHPGCATVSAALVAAEKTGSSGKAFLRAVVLGYDVGGRVPKALVRHLFVEALRSTHGFGNTFGAGAAAGALYGFDQPAMTTLLSYCAQLASGCASQVRDSEHMEKAFVLGGRPAHHGVMAANLTAAGFTGPPDVFSGERNFLDAYSPKPDRAQLSAELGKRFEITLTNIKKWCVGSPIQAALDSTEFLMHEEGLTPDQVKSVAIHLHPQSARTIDASPMADINMQHLVGLMLVDGTITFASCHDHARMKDKRILALKEHIRLVPSEMLAKAKPVRQAIVEVETKDGRKLSKRTYSVRGTADNPMTRQEVVAKARDLMDPILGKARAGRLVEAIISVENVANMKSLRPLLSAATPKTGRARH